MTQLTQRNQMAANDARAEVDVNQHRLQIDVDVTLLEALLREKQLAADRIRPCNGHSAAVLRDLLLDCLQAPRASRR